VQTQQAWVVSVDMGYGHQRAAHPFRDLAFERMITANTDPAVQPRERTQWRRFQLTYESLSRLSGIPGIGRFLWELYDSFQRIAKRYPMRDLSSPTTVTTLLNFVIGRGFGSGVIDYIRNKRPDLPLLTSFYVPALVADRRGLDRVYCIVTDTDLHRVWVAQHPDRSQIYYCAPTIASRRRLLAYGVPEEHIYLTGFPLPGENVARVQEDLRRRLARLDPERLFYPRLKEVIEREVGPLETVESPVTITYAVGGAGAQKEVGAKLLASAADSIREGRLRINLVAGIRQEIATFFEEQVRLCGLGKQLGSGVRVLLEPDKHRYFDRFNEWLRDTDILWTKPSELVFYTALGIPLVMTEPLGAHEEYNREWILELGAGITQEDPQYAAEWLLERITCGILAEAAFAGYLKAPRQGTENIRRLLFAEDRELVKLDFNEAYSPMQVGSWRRRWHRHGRKRGQEFDREGLMEDARTGSEREDCDR